MNLANANNYLGLNLFQILSKDEGNIFISPFSISSAMAMLFHGAGSEAAKELQSVLGYDIAQIEEEDVKTLYHDFLQEFENHPGSYTITSANSLVCQKGYHVKKEYKTLLSDFFKATVQEADFVNEMEKAVKAINEWINENTKGMIHNCFHSLDPATKLVTLNVVYFKGFWKHQFDKTSTRLQNFYVNWQKDNLKEVPMMNIKDYFYYGSKEHFEVLELPYVGREISMLILLPDSASSLEDLENSFNNDFIENAEQDMASREINVALPKFKLEFSKSLVKSFQTLGLEKLFILDSYLSGITDSEEFGVSDISHTAVIDVNEEGCEAAATTGTCFAKGVSPDFIVDHPFIFLIYNKRNKLILFMGRVNEL